MASISINEVWLETQLDKAFQKYDEQVRRLAREAFDEVVRPFCEKHGFRFKAGNGIWYLYDPSEALPEWNTLPKRRGWQKVKAVLETEIPHYEANDLGSLMPD